MAKVRWSLTARDDLRLIEEFVGRDSVRYAVRLVSRIVEVAGRLELFPLSGRVVPEYGREDLREVLFGSYRIVYRADESGTFILRVVHGARNITSVAEQEPWDAIE